MDKLQRWMERIQRAPQREVANLDYWDLLLETRIEQETVGAALSPTPHADTGKSPCKTIGHPLIPS